MERPPKVKEVIIEYSLTYRLTLEEKEKWTQDDTVEEWAPPMILPRHRK
jgi:hypothetical protein